jgi:hypothetical protein
MVSRSLEGIQAEFHIPTMNSEQYNGQYFVEVERSIANIKYFQDSDILSKI